MRKEKGKSEERSEIVEKVKRRNRGERSKDEDELISQNV
jgi:hypothetical protein